MNISESLLHWYNLNKRPLAWRETLDPYKIWLSEVILQQTRVIQGTNYYHRFLQAFPDVQSLALAKEQDVLKLWQGLGYYSRARNMHYTAKEIVNKYNGIFPSKAAELKKLKGIGDYTAAAIASICFNEAVPVLDGNVARVISRIFAIETSIDSSAGRSEIIDMAAGMMNQSNPGQFNQALMELGALVCTPKNPSCLLCPLMHVCEAFKHKNTEMFPVKNVKKVPVKRYMNYVISLFANNNEEFVVMRKRTGNDIWKNMFDFPCIETESETEPDKVLELCVQQNWFTNNDFNIIKTSKEYIHQLSHRTLLVRFIVLKLKNKPLLSHGISAIRKNDVEKLPVPRLIDKFLTEEILISR